MRSELFTKIIISVAVFILGFIIFKCLQNETIFNNTLGRIAITYQNISEKGSHNLNVDVIKTKNSYTTLDDANFIHWDVKFFKFMADNSYGKDDTWPGVGTYAFSPLFPFIWKLTHLPAKYIAILNYLLFVISLLILSNLFLSTKDFGKTERLCLFAMALTLPTVLPFFIPYCESTFMFTFCIALWGLFKNKYWLFFTGMVLFSLSRPSFLIVGLAFIVTDVYYLVLNKDFKLFIKEMGSKLLPVFIGMLITFFIQYLSSGNFFKMFEVHSRFWNHTIQYPKTISDWSTEGYGMNIFSIFIIVLPLSLLIVTYLLKHQDKKMIPPVSLFSPETRNEYLFNYSVIYFAGNFLFVFLTQGGNLNGLHRYIMTSPFFYIFLFLFISKIKSIKLVSQIVMLIPLVIFGYLSLIHGTYQHSITFLDMGYFLCVLTMIYFVLFNRVKLPVKLTFLVLIILCNTIWLTYIFNHFLNNAFIII